MSEAPKSVLRLYLKCFLAWTLVGLFFFLQSLVQRRFSHDATAWWHYFASWMVGSYVGAILTPPVLWLGRRFPIGRSNWPRRTILHVLFSVTFALVQLASESVILSRLGVFPAIMGTFLSTFLFLLVIGFNQNMLSYWTILGLQYGVTYYRRYREREEQALRLELNATALKAALIRAQLSALKMQLQPHFLFNTLNAIMVLVRQQRGSQAEEMLARLSDLLRCVLEDVDAQEVSLRRELEVLQLYLAIEQVRFQDRLRVEITADPAALDAAVPQMGLQPIVENAVRHGVGRSSAAGKIQITAVRVNGALEVNVQDDGPGFPPANSAADSGIGLANTRARLRQLYGDQAKLTVENGLHGGASVTLTLPYHLAPPIPQPEVMEVHASKSADRR